MTLKRFIVCLCIVFICSITFIGGYTKSACIVYADSTTDTWTQITTNDQLVTAFRYYCKSRDLTIDGSIADGVTQFTTKTFNGICNTLGIDQTALQAQIKYQTDGNLGLRFLFSSVSLNAMNRIFAQFLQDNDLEVGDSANEANNTVYSGSIFTDADGISCLVYIINNFSNATNNIYAYPNDAITAHGTYYKYSNSYLVSITNTTDFNYIGKFQLTTTRSPYVYTRYRQESGNYYYYTLAYGASQNYTFTFSTNWIDKTSAYPCIIYDSSQNIYYLGYYGTWEFNGNPYEWVGTYSSFTPDSGSNQNATVYLTTNNTVINNNTYEGDTVINNNGDTNNYYPDNPGTTTPPTNTGGGSGEDDGTITFPDFDFHLPEINWSLGDLSEKFPFSIPFDLIAFFTVLNAEPRAPAIDADIPLGTWYTWHFEADFAQFDDYAVIIRNVEFIGFCVGLIYLTIKLVKG